MNKIRILVFNVGYMRGITGFLSPQYVLKMHRVFLPSAYHANNLAKDIAEKIRDVNPDIVFLSEIREGSHMAHFKDLFRQHHIDSKYGEGSALNLVPFFRGNCNGLFLREAYKVHKRYFKNGIKKLVYEIEVDNDRSIFFAHFALGSETRKKQFGEIIAMIKESNKKGSVIAGDFNTFGGVDELDHFLKSGFHVANDLNEKTFPSNKPAHAIDLFLTSAPLENVQVLKWHLSDHLPVVAEIAL